MLARGLVWLVSHKLLSYTHHNHRITSTNYRLSFPYQDLEINIYTQSMRNSVAICNFGSRVRLFCFETPPSSPFYPRRRLCRGSPIPAVRVCHIFPWRGGGILSHTARVLPAPCPATRRVGRRYYAVVGAPKGSTASTYDSLALLGVMGAKTKRVS